MPRHAAVAALLLAALPAAADGPKDNVVDNVRPIPPKGTAVPDDVRKALRDGLTGLREEIDSLPAALKGKPALLDLVPDVEVFHKAVRYAIEYDELYADKGRNDAAAAKRLIQQGSERAKQLRDGKAPWATATGLVVRGYRSKIDGSVQPYGLVVPPTYSPVSPHRHRLDLWWHGRGETLTEINFLDQRLRLPGEFTPPNALVLHPYGRYCNANKFAGEVDTFEAMEHVRKHYPIDDTRITARGFSMGGAACWQFAVHYPTLWAAAAPGAGFSETPDFLQVFQNEKVQPTWYEQRLWRMYNATDSALNLFNLPTVAYSGEDDRQIQAARMMEKALEPEGIRLTHVVGPKTGHRYEPGAKAEVNRRIDAILAKGRDPVPSEVRFVTYTLRYNRCGWLTVDGLAKHWEKATVTGNYSETGRVFLRTSGVTALSIDIPPGYAPPGRAPEVLIDREKVWTGPTASDRSLSLHFRQTDGKWLSVPAAGPDGLAKRPGLQGPIDDAFLDEFLMVKPTGKPLHETTGNWVRAEAQRAVEHWRKHFRGDAPVSSDTAVTADDIRDANLILWGDPSSNAVLAKIADKLPVKWTPAGVVVGDRTYDAAHHVPVLVYPNPLNPRRYVVLNSGFTFREYDYLNNARQVPKLPDYAVIDIRTPPNPRSPGKVVRAGFFGERWELLPNDGQ